MDLLQTLITQGGLGIVAGVFFWLYVSERNEHKETRKEKDALMEARRVDAKEVADNITEPLRGISQGIGNLNDKIIMTQAQRNK